MVQFEALKSSKGFIQNNKGYWILDCEGGKKYWLNQSECQSLLTAATLGSFCFVQSLC